MGSPSDVPFDAHAYSAKWLQSRFLEYYKDQIITTNINGKSNVVTFFETASKIIQEFNENKDKRSKDDEKMRIIETVARILKNDIKSMELSIENYPTPGDMEYVDLNLAYLPSSLKVLLTKAFSAKDSPVQVASIVVTPLQIGLAVQMHRHFGSRFLVASLNSHRFCSSYHEAQEFERSAALFQGTEIPELNYVNDSVFMQHSADNVDHNIRTIDELNTFHGMGIIVSVTPKLNRNCIIPRLREVSSQDILNVSQIESHLLPSQHKSKVSFERLPSLIVSDKCILRDLWSSTWLFHSQQPLWNGFMQSLSEGSRPEVSSVLVLPMIDQKSTDASCILSTMHFVCNQASGYNIKLSESNNSRIKDCVLRLGGFHRCMSFLGAVGHLMQGNGLASIFDLIYADSTVPYMMCGKAVSRATRAHLILYACLIGFQMAKKFNFDLLTDDNGECCFQEDLPEEIKALFELSQHLSKDEISVEEIEKNETFIKAKSMIVTYRNQGTDSKTAKLWFQYMDTVEILCRFIHVERSGNWQLHLQATRDMLPYFVASGHYLYAESAYLYLQSMINLPETHPSVYKQFQDRFHVVRRSDLFRTGLSSGLVIEQVFMRSIKTTGGLTRERGFTDIQRAVWLLSTPVTSEVNQAMQKFTGTNYETSEQHKETMVSRLSRDHSDALKSVTYLSVRSPFESSNDLMNISSGEVCNEAVNVYQAKGIGENVIKSMESVSVFYFSFKKKNMAVTMPTKSSLTIDNKSISVDSQLLFQRLIAIARQSPEELENAFAFELSTLRASLFDKDGLMNEANKPQLSDAIWKAIGEHESSLPDNTFYTLDGGALMHRLPWTKGQTFDSICQSYVKHILTNYGTRVTVVFDGYHGPSTKDTTHIRRSKGQKSVLVKVSFKNQNNKQGFIEMLGQELQKAKVGVKHSDGDTDLLIVQTSLEIANNHKVTVIGEDTDLLILLLHQKLPKSNPVFLTIEEQSKHEIQTKDLGHTVCKLCSGILVIHAFPSCDTTSRVHKCGKATIFNKFQINDECRRLVKMLSSEDKSKPDILAAGEKLIIMLTGGTKEKPLDELRYSKYSRTLGTTKKALSPEMHGPTSDATSLHVMRVYHQVQIWKGGTDLEINEWGWMLKNNFVLPVPMTKPPGPANIFKLIRCSSQNDCTGRCTLSESNVRPCVRIAEEFLAPTAKVQTIMRTMMKSPIEVHDLLCMYYVRRPVFFKTEILRS